MAFRHIIKSEGAAIDDTMPALTTPRRLVAFTLHASAAPTTADVLYVRLKNGLGEEYDVILYSLTLSTTGTTDIVRCGDLFGVPLFEGDAIQVEYANTDANTIGIQLIFE